MPSRSAGCTDRYRLLSFCAVSAMRQLATAGTLLLTFCSCQVKSPDQTVTGGDAPHRAAPVSTDVVRIDGVEKQSGAVSDCSSPKQGRTDTAADTRSQRKYPLQPNPLAGCSLCHVDVEDECVGGKHFDESIGCKTCHGPSEGHLADENNEVKPDEVFDRKDVDRLCGNCHECARPEASETVKHKGERPEVCTDCHGHHDLVLAQKTGPSED